MNVLILTTAYGAGRPHAGLTESLSAAMVEEGHSVRVACIDWDAEPGGETRHFTEPNGVEVVMTAPAASVLPGKIGRLLSKWIWSSRAAVGPVRAAFGDRHYDLLIVMTPAVTLRALILWALPRSRGSYAYVTDFFPIQHVNAGLLPPWLSGVAKRAETGLLRRFDVIGTMSDLGVEFLRSRFLLSGKAIERLYLWTAGAAQTDRPRAETRSLHGLPLTQRIAVFGGQMTSGRGIEDILAVARRAKGEQPLLGFLFLGDGPLRSLVEDAALQADANVYWRRTLPRNEYLDVIASCDIGLIATVQAHETPVFPSKTLDYLKAGLPIVASVEDASDFKDFVRANGFGIATPAGRPDQLYEALVSLSNDENRLDGMRAAGANAFERYFSAASAASQIIRSVAARSSVAGEAASVK